MDRYRRTSSFPHPNPNPNPNPNPDRPSKPPAAKSLHVRSCSLPCVRSQPLVPQLRDEINELRSWANSRPTHSTHSHLASGLARLKSVLDSLDDVLQMPQTHDDLSRRPHLVEKLLENFLQFVDAFGIFQGSVLALKQDLSGARLALRRNHLSKLALHAKSQKKIAKELAKLISAVRSIHCPVIATTDAHDEIPSMIRDVHELTGAVSAAVFDGVIRSLGGSGTRSRSTSWGGFGLSWKEQADVEEKKADKMKELEALVRGMEDGSERVFRSLICTRVSLLNILTHI